MTLSTLTRRMLQQFCTSAGVGKSIADKLDAGDTDSLTDYERRRLAFAMGSQVAANKLADCLSSGDDLPDWVRRKLVFVGGQFAGDEIGDAVDAITSNIEGLPPESVLGIWFASNYDATKKVIPNIASSVTVRDVVTRNPRGLFNTGKAPGNGAGGGWLGGGFDGMTVTEKYAANADGINVGTRIVFSTTTNGLRYRTNATLAAGTYTMAIDVKSNNGSTQDFLMSRNGGSTTVTKTATTSWQRFTLEFTLASSTAVDLRFLKPSSGSGDFVIDNAYLWRGAESTLPSTMTWGGHIQVGDNDTESVSCTGAELALTSSQAAYMAFDAVQDSIAWSVYAVVKRTAAYTTAGSGRYPFFFTPNESSAWGSSGTVLALGDYDAEGYLQGKFGVPKIAQGKKGSNWTTGDSPDLATDAGYHVISMKCQGTGSSNGNTIEVWIDDCILFTTINTQSQTALNWFVAAIGGNNGLSRHKINALACYAKYHTENETKQTIEALIDNAAASSLTITRPKNHIIAEGDSITQGPSVNSYVQQAFPNLTGTGTTVVNWACSSGSMLTTHTTVGLNVTDRLTAFHLPGIPDDLTGRRCIYSILIGANDLSDYASASAYLTALYAVTDQARAQGAKVIICTVLPKSSAWSGYTTHNSFRATLNAQLRLDVVGGGSGNNKFDALADFANDATMGPDAAASNATYYSDGLHPTAAGHALLEPIWRAAVNSLLI